MVTGGTHTTNSIFNLFALMRSSHSGLTDLQVRFDHAVFRLSCPMLQKQVCRSDLITFYSFVFTYDETCFGQLLGLEPSASAAGSVIIFLANMRITIDELHLLVGWYFRYRQSFDRLGAYLRMRQVGHE